MTEETSTPISESDPLELQEAQLRRSAAYQKHRLVVVSAFLVAIVACGLGFKPLGEALGRLGANVFDSLVTGGTSAGSAGLAVLLGANAIGFVVVLLLSLFFGPRVPSGFPHVVLGITVPLSLATMQATMLRLTDGAGGLGETEFARWSFVAMFLITLAAAETGVTIGRRWLEKRAK
jgi:hypothetical protein